MSSLQVFAARREESSTRSRIRPLILECLVGAFVGLALSSPFATLWPRSSPQTEELLGTDGEVGRYGGRLVVAERTEPKTLNPVMALDDVTLEVVRRMTADLIHINRQTQRTEPALAKAWKVSRDARRYTLELRHGVRFSDGHPFTARDVLFSFRVYLDEKVHAPQRDLLIVGGKPIQIEQVDPYTLQFELAQPYAAAERIFDSVAILPEHRLEKAYQEGKISAAWGLQTSPDKIAGLGPFRLKEYVPGQRLALERNPYYWKVDRKGNQLPYLDEIDFLFVANQDAQAMRFEAGETDVVSGLNAENFAVLEDQQQHRGYRLYDVGPGLEYDFLFFNLNDLGSGAPAEAVGKQRWFRELKFRQAVSAAIDRSAIVRLVYRSHGTALWSHVTPGNKLWVDSSLPKPDCSHARARSLLEAAGFHWDSKGILIDSDGKPVEFSVITNAGNAARTQIATIVQSDLAELGMQVQVVRLESRSLLDRVFTSHDYEACVLGLVSGDADPNPEMNVWLSNGSMHLWNLVERQPEWPWEAEIDHLMRQQATTLNLAERKRLYDRVQLLVGENLPLICIVSPNVLVGGKSDLGNFNPTVLGDYVLWNADQLFFRHDQGFKNK